ncbi:MAG: IS21 family transposase, partial [Aureliella sp.]
MLKVEDFELIRRMVLVDGLSQREVARRLNKSRNSVSKALVNSEPGSYVLKQPKSRPVTDPVAAIVKTWLEEDLARPRKQRHTKTRIFERLRDEYQFTGSRRAISNLVGKFQDKPAEVFCPIDHPPADEVQIDWGEATAVLAGQTTKVMIFCARSAYSKATYVRAYLRDDMVSFLDGHVWLFEQLGGIPRKLAYDNLKTAVTHVYLGNKRDLTARFLALRSHYLFESRFCNVASGNEKGHVENSVKRSERTY